MKIWTEPKVAVICRPLFSEPDHLRVERIDGNDQNTHSGWGAPLVEYAGRLCYMSQANPSGKTTTEYIENILKQRHGSVAEHASWSLLIEGVSRSLTHELVRHRAGTAYSQLSQRFVEGFEAVVPPAILELNDAEERDDWTRDMERAEAAYNRRIVRLRSKGITGKKLKEAARSHLPNAAETKLTMTANARAWRHIIELRSGEGADAEIRRLFRAVLAVLKAEAPALFGDFDENGVPKYSKV